MWTLPLTCPEYIPTGGSCIYHTSCPPGCKRHQTDVGVTHTLKDEGDEQHLDNGGHHSVVGKVGSCNVLDV